MVVNRKKKPPKGIRSGKPQNQVKQTTTMQVRENLRHDFGGMQFAATIMQQARDTIRNTRVDKALIEILKTVRNWPTRIKEAGSDSFEPPFSATEIHAEAITKDSEIITSVSFSYSGETYDFVSRLKEDPSSDNSHGVISLHENGAQVIDMAIVQNDSSDEFNFRELNTLNFGTWIDNIVRIEEEIKSHNKG